jgi:hypothetical protein
MGARLGYVLGQLGHDFVSETRVHAFKQHGVESPRHRAAVPLAGLPLKGRAGDQLVVGTAPFFAGLLGVRLSRHPGTRRGCAAPPRGRRDPASGGP